MGMTTTYTLQNLKSGADLHPTLKGYFLTPESVEPIQDLLDNVTANDACAIPSWDWTCVIDHTETEAKTRMAQFLTQMDGTLNPHRLLTTSPNAVRVLDPRIRDIVTHFLPNLHYGEGYSYSEIEASASQFGYIAQKSGLELFAKESPCHTNDPSALTCTWSNFPSSVDDTVWLEAGATLHPRLTNTYFTKRAAAGLRILLKKADPEAQTQLADLVLTIDKTFNPYCVRGQTVIIDGSVRTLEHLTAQEPSPFPGHFTNAYAWAITNTFNLKWAGYFSVNSGRHYQMLCEAHPLMDIPFIGATTHITCSYMTTAADVD